MSANQVSLSENMSFGRGQMCEDDSRPAEIPMWERVREVLDPHRWYRVTEVAVILGVSSFAAMRCVCHMRTNGTAVMRKEKYKTVDGLNRTRSIVKVRPTEHEFEKMRCAAESKVAARSLSSCMLGWKPQEETHVS